MMSSTAGSGRKASGLSGFRVNIASARALMGVLVGVAAALALSVPSAYAAGACPNEKLREESNLNPATGEPYSVTLPDCRAYEMVSPLEKGGQPAGTGGLSGTTVLPLAVSPDGERVGWSSEGAFDDPENFIIQEGPVLVYLSHHETSGWATASVFPPRELLDDPATNGFDGDFSEDLLTDQVACGATPESAGEKAVAEFRCVARKQGGPWVKGELYKSVDGGAIFGSEDYLGGSQDLSRVFYQPVHLEFGLPLERPPADSQVTSGGSDGIYEVTRIGAGKGSETLRLVNVDNRGHEMVIKEGGQNAGPFLGDERENEEQTGSASHAISDDGKTVFFTATPPEAAGAAGEVLTIYARVQCTPTEANKGTCKEDGHAEYFETVGISNGEECSACNPAALPQEAIYQGASADGTKVFFTTRQGLLAEEEQEGERLYEYDFNRPTGERLVLLSPGSEPKVEGVVRASQDGSHIYFVAKGVLTGEEKNNFGEQAKALWSNLYGYDTVTGQTRFVATSSGAATEFDVEPSSAETKTCKQYCDFNRHVQTTPDGRVLAFTSRAKIADNIAKRVVPRAYRYDFQTGELTWISHSAPGFTTPESAEEEALIAPRPGAQIKLQGADASAEDWSRAISGLKVGESNREYTDVDDGEYIIFTTNTKLQANDVSGARSLYEWHNGIVSLISDGRDPKGVETEGNNEEGSAMSATGGDIFFGTFTQLVGQDTDALRDIYDARIGGGFPGPPPPPCDTCQPAESTGRKFGPAPSSYSPAGGNLSPSSGVLGLKVAVAVKLTPAQELAKAVKACKSKPKSKRAACEAQAKKKYRAQLLAAALKACNKKPKAKRPGCDSQARKRYGR